jgi:hypothetical protein
MVSMFVFVIFMVGMIFLRITPVFVLMALAAALFFMAAVASTMPAVPTMPVPEHMHGHKK